MICMECGGTYEQKGIPNTFIESRFCCTEHRMRFNNRRAKRGAELYDLFMAMRYDRKKATLLGLYGIICRLASIWREQDQGRKSWSDPERIIARNPALTAKG